MLQRRAKRWPQWNPVLPKLSTLFDHAGMAPQDPGRAVPGIERDEFRAVISLAEGNADQAVALARKAADEAKVISYAFGPPISGSLHSSCWEKSCCTSTALRTRRKLSGRPCCASPGTGTRPDFFSPWLRRSVWHLIWRESSAELRAAADSSIHP